MTNSLELSDSNCRKEASFLESLGFEVKGEICGCDIVALKGSEPIAVVIGELKVSFNLELLLQACKSINKQGNDKY